MRLTRKTPLSATTAKRLKRIPIKRKFKRRKKSPLAKANEQLEALQKQLVIKTYGNDCFTCPAKNLQKNNCQLGHVPWPRSILSTLCKYDYRFTRIQCFKCNVYYGGMGAKALERMQMEGTDTDEMWKISECSKGKVYSLKQRLAKAAHYTTLLSN